MGESNFFFKILLIGDSSIGKSSLLLRFTENTYTEGYSSTIGSDFKVRSIELGDGKVAKLQVWDTAGQERFRTITSSYYRGAHGIIVGYDVSCRESFQNVKQWLGEIDRYASQNVKKVLIGMKSDVDDAPTEGFTRQVSLDEASQFASDVNIRHDISSAKNGFNCDKCFLDLTNDIIASQPSSGSSAGGNIIITSGREKKKGKCFI